MMRPSPSLSARTGSSRHLAALATVVAVVGLFALGPATPPAAADAAPVARDAVRTEIHRLINGERAAAGLAPLRIDLLLSSRAHDAPFSCPGAGTTPGRALDVALHNGLSHELGGCPDGSVLDVMPSWGYHGPTGEILAYNHESSELVTYRYGCPPGSRAFDCPGGGGTATVSRVAATAVRMWIDSPSHHPIIDGDYDRFGCGAWTGTATTAYGSGGTYFACVFAKGGVVARLDARPPTVAGIRIDGAATASAGERHVAAGAGAIIEATARDSEALGRIAGWEVTVDGRVVVDPLVGGRVDAGRGAITVRATIPTADLAPGTHAVVIRTLDLAGRWSAATTVSLIVAP
jgi:uncharacterized protein YkwD